MSPDEFARRRSGQARSPDRLLVYVHGHSVGFDAAAEVGVRLKERLGFEKVVVFSWPVVGPMSREDYLRDRDIASRSRSFMKRFFEEYVYKDRSLNYGVIIAHSLGNLLALEAMREVSLQISERPRFLWRFLSVAPDVSKKYFEVVLLPSIDQLLRDATIYIATNDVMLTYSKQHFDDDPVGLAPPIVQIGKNFQDKWDIVDVSSISCRSVIDVCHSYHLGSPYMQSELLNVIEGVSPEDRLNLVPRDEDGARYYYFQPK